MVKSKFVIRGTLLGKNNQVQFSRDTKERALGIAENFENATIFRRTASDKGLIKIWIKKGNNIQEVSIKEQLKRARELVK